MRTVELLEEALRSAVSLGYHIRQEYLEGRGGGACEYGGRKWLFIDASLPLADQLEAVTLVLQDDPATQQLTVSSDLHRMVRRAA